VADELPAGVRPDVVAALVMPDPSDYAENLLNSNEAERKLARDICGQLAEFDSWQASMLGFIVHELRPYWRDPKRKLMDVLAEVPDDVRQRVLKILDTL
jgi:hypothetical protein